MSMLAGIQKGVIHKPPRMVIYGPHGVGKTSLSAGAPAPIIVQAEDGADEIGVDRFPLSTTYEHMMDCLETLVNEEHSYQTCILDSADWAERLVTDYVCRREGWRTIAQPDFGKGFAALSEEWMQFMAMLKSVHERGMALIITAHAEVTHFDDPTTEGYDRYQIALNKRTAPELQEGVDAVLFMNWRIVTAEAKEGMGRKITKGKGNGARVLYTEERPAALAKNRYRMPYRIDLPNEPEGMFGAVSQHIPFFSAQ
ncbi:hypothetical protein AAJCM20276_27360 [Acetobacter aceti]|uniref:Uncharacterized protein n=1 Tax=Acetobacter aceti TaxID=435 RepID=A0A6S6PTR1_ACEAC|nr:ATP-binding protein [Acetobacter aceti]BCI68112.1 hypothetical protein AAJCM20276_27360 [Acetobacter aceti]